ncbi:hypothetical protein DYB32_001240 [Aphanomyces invadans]|uniref:TPR1-like CTLH-containing domain-containing protein n=1 Tax=Aphanomyces invadans TaxID=157072 RepID=A0A418B6Z6_9STRA|nr:hypothetical protein DYB32_001240 [Aphanomyces invadans]
MAAIIPPFRFTTVENRLYRGAYPTLPNFRFLRRLKLKTLISVIPEKPTKDLVDFCMHEGIAHHTFQAEKYSSDSVTVPPATVAAILHVLLNNDNLPIYIHYRDEVTGRGAAGSSTRKVPTNMSTQDEWSSFKLVDKHLTSIAPEATFDAASDEIKEDILRLIVQYLQNEGYTSASATILDEANVKLMEKHQEREMVRKISKSIKEGDWDLVAKMIHKNSNLRKVKFHTQQGLGFLYAVCKEEYLELIDRQEYQKAFTYLTTHLKPMEKISGRQEFKDLCYLLTCKSITEVESFRDWEGVVKSREKLAEQLKATFELDAVPTEHINIPDNRLVNLLHQSVAYQMEFSRYHPKTVPKVSTLLRDFECQVLPNAVKTTFVGHSQNVKVRIVVLTVVMAHSIAVRNLCGPRGHVHCVGFE